MRKKREFEIKEKNEEIEEEENQKMTIKKENIINFYSYLWQC